MTLDFKMVRNRSSWRHDKELWFHVYFAEAGDAAGELEEGLYALENAHMREADFLERKLKHQHMEWKRHGIGESV